MRSFLILISTVALLVGGFLVYWWAQPNPVGQQATRGMELGQVDPLKPKEGGPLVGQGSGVWVKRYDEKTGRATSQFRASDYVPQNDGTVKVTSPQAEFFINELQTLKIRGSDGDVVSPAVANQDRKLGGGRAQLPTRGSLRNVTIDLFDSPTSTQPTLSVEMPNAAFDNDTFRIYTEAYTAADGTKVTADNVPVRVRGDDYEFDGKGLVIRWNELDQRLQILEVAHGERLKVKHPSAVSGLTSSKPAGGQAAAPVAGPVAGSQPATVATTKPAPIATPVYRATLGDRVRIMQGTRELALASQMLLDFRQQEARSGSSSASSARSAEGVKATSPPAPASAPVKRAADEPIEILWNGKLTLVPLEGTPLAPIGPGESAVQLIGGPLILHPEGSLIECASLIFQTASGTLQLLSSEKAPLLMRDDHGSTVACERLDYSRQTGLAVLRGKGKAHLLMSGNEPGAEPMDATWAKSCSLHVVQGKGDQLLMDRVALDGAVQINHPQLQLAGQSLEIDFDTPDAASQPARRGGMGASTGLKRILAAGDVHGVLPDSKNNPQAIDCQKLVIETARGADGKVYPRTFQADGATRLRDSQQELAADHVVVTLAPASTSATRPTGAFASSTVQLEQLIAEKDVKLHNRENAFATGDRLVLEVKDQKPVITLIGAPHATIGDAQGTLTGPQISIAPKESRADVVGPGSMRSTFPATKDSAARPLAIDWSGGLSVNGDANLVQIKGKVQVKSAEADGSGSEASADSLTLKLVPRSKPATSRPADSPSQSMADMNFMRDKDPGEIILEENVELKSVLADRDGTLQRRMHLFAQTVDYNLPGRRMTVPGPGRMLYEDRRAATTQPDQSPDARGATAFQWQQKLVYDEIAKQAILAGKVVMVHQPEGSKIKSIRMDAEQVTTDLGTAGGDAARPSLKHLIAEGGVKFSARGAQFDAQRVEFDPASGKATATGTDRLPAQLYDDQGLTTGSFQELIYNSRTEQIDRLTGFVASVNRSSGR